MGLLKKERVNGRNTQLKCCYLRENILWTQYGVPSFFLFFRQADFQNALWQVYFRAMAPMTFPPSRLSRLITKPAWDWVYNSPIKTYLYLYGSLYINKECSLVCIWEELSGNVEDTPEFLAWCGSRFVDPSPRLLKNKICIHSSSLSWNTAHCPFFTHQSVHSRKGRIVTALWNVYTQFCVFPPQ